MTKWIGNKEPDSRNTIVNYDFKELFNLQNYRDCYKCDCGYINLNLQFSEKFDFSQTIFLFIRFQITHLIVRKENLNKEQELLLDFVKINKFDPNNIKIQDDEFYLKSFVRFYPSNIQLPISGGGHYTCIKRINNTDEWSEISDDTAKRCDFIKDLSNVYVMFLEKKINKKNN